MRVEILLGSAAPDVLRDAAHLEAETAVPVTSRHLWLQTWARHHPAWEPWVFVARDEGGAVTASVGLARRRVRSTLRVIALGHGSSDQLRFPFRDIRDLQVLIRAVSRELDGHGGSWRLHLRQLSCPATIRLLTEAFERPSDLAGLACPTVRFAEDRTLAAYTSRNYRAQARHKWNRLSREVGDVSVLRLRAARDIEPWVDTVMRVARRRDHEIAGRSRLDDAAYRAFFRDLLMVHADHGEAELGLLCAGGHAVAHSVAFLDGRTYRQWNKHFDSTWKAYRPGHVLDAQLLAAVLDDDRFVEWDWMAGREDYKSRTATDVVDCRSFVAGSRAVMHAHRLRERVRTRIGPVADMPPVARRLVETAKRIERKTWSSR